MVPRVLQTELQTIFGHKEGEEMAESKCTRGEQMKGMLIAGVVGAIAGLLLAPSSGKELIEDIKDKGDEAVGLSKRFYNDAKDKADQILKEAYEGADNLKDEAERVIEEALGKVEEILAAAEKKTASTRESLESLAETASREVSKRRGRRSTWRGLHS